MQSILGLLDQKFEFLGESPDPDFSFDLLYYVLVAQDIKGTNSLCVLKDFNRSETPLATSPASFWLNPFFAQKKN